MFEGPAVFLDMKYQTCSRNSIPTFLYSHTHTHTHTPQVENIGDAYMVISGAPISTPHHAEYITDFAFSSIEATSKINDPSTQNSLRIRVGMWSPHWKLGGGGYITFFVWRTQCSVSHSKSSANFKVLTIIIPYTCS